MDLFRDCVVTFFFFIYFFFDAAAAQASGGIRTGMHTRGRGTTDPGRRFWDSKSGENRKLSELKFSRIPRNSNFEFRGAPCSILKLSAEFVVAVFRSACCCPFD